MSEFIGINSAGRAELTLPPSAMFVARWVGPDTYMVGWGELTADADRLDVIRMQNVLTTAMCEARDAAECLTPEDLARAPHRPFDGGRTVGT